LREINSLFPLSSQQFAAAAHDLVDANIGVFPGNPRSKGPMIAGGRGVYDATLDHEQIEAWAWKYPGAVVAAAVPIGVVVADPDGARGREDFIRLSGGTAPEDMSTPTVKTPHGWHLWFKTNGSVFSNRRIPGAAIDIKTHPGCYVLMPMGFADRFWLPGKPRKPMLRPQWLLDAAAIGPRHNHFPDTAPPTEPTQSCGVDSAYGRAALEAIIRDIANTQDGAQELTFSAGALKVARLIASGDLVPTAIEAVRAAAYAMPNYRPNKPWRRLEIDRKIDRQLERGRANPWLPVDWTQELTR
jgi:hypothetical protein